MRNALRMLTRGPATCSALAERLGVGRGGSLSENLQELCEAGFVAKDEGLSPATLRPSKLARYRVSDNYTRFYLKYVEPHEAEIRSGRFAFSSLASLEGWQADMGHQFENLVVNYVRRLVPHLHLEWGRVKSAAPFEIRSDRKGTRKGVQIDLLVQAQGMAILVEIKRRSRIGSDVEAEMRRKLEVFPRRRNVSVRTTLVYEGELDGSVANGGVFDFVIPIETLLS